MAVFLLVVAVTFFTGCGRDSITAPIDMSVQFDNPDGLQFVPADYGRYFAGLAHYPRYLTFRGTESELTVHYLRVRGGESLQSIGVSYLVMTPRGRWDDTVFVGVAQISGAPNLDVIVQGQEEISRLLRQSYPSMLDRLAAVQSFIVGNPGIARKTTELFKVKHVVVLPDTILPEEQGYMTEILEYFR